MYALAKPHGPCRGSSGSDMHKQINESEDRNGEGSKSERGFLVVQETRGCSCRQAMQRKAVSDHDRHAVVKAEDTVKAEVQPIQSALLNKSTEM
jgi:hypothetical protein